METAWKRAEQAKDVAALDHLLAPDRLTSITTAAFPPSRNSSPTLKTEGLSPEQISNEQQTAHVFGDCVMVTGIYREKGVNKGKPYNRRGCFTDTWVKVNNTWQCVASQSTLIQH